MKILSWNVNGIRARLKQNPLNFIQQFDICCFQETKTPDLPEELLSLGYHSFLHKAQKPGYSGVAILTKKEPEFLEYSEEGEGRLIIAHYDNCIIFNGYFPNGASSSLRHEYKLNFYSDFMKKLTTNYNKPIILTGDFNIAHKPIDVIFFEKEEKTSGFLPEERKIIDDLTESYIDTFRFLYPELQKFSWFDYRTKAYLRKEGWRIDYFFLSKEYQHLLKNAEIYTDSLFGSDHSPLGLELNIE